MLYRTMPRRRVYNPGARGKTLAYFRIPLLSTVPAALIPANTLLVIPAPLAATGPCQTPCADFTSTYQSYILQVIQFIIDRVNLDTVLSSLQELQQEITTKAQAEAAGKLFDLTDEEMAWLQIVPYKGSLPTAVPTDPLIYRWYEIVSVYGTTIKELIHEEFGDGIMSAIDFSMDIVRQPDPKGDRVNVVLSGKFLPYKQY